MRDYQQTALYNWERSLPDGGWIDISNAQAIVNYIWEKEGLHYPPTVQPIAPQTTKWAGQGGRLEIQLQPRVTMKTIIHEISHSMTGDIESQKTMLHGPWFVGVYVKLLEKYLNVPMPLMLYTLNEHNVDFDINAHPIFLDV